jgi:hypothetical protein
MADHCVDNAKDMSCKIMLGFLEVSTHAHMGVNT